MNQSATNPTLWKTLLKMIFELSKMVFDS